MLSTMLKTVFFATAASQDWSPQMVTDKVNPAEIKRAFIDVIEHVIAGDCRALQLEVGSSSKTAINTFGDAVDELGNILGKENPMIGPIIMMGKSYVLTSGLSAIDSLVNDHLCENLIHNVPDTVKKEVIPKVKEVIQALENPKLCDKLKATSMKAKTQIKNAANDAFTTFITNLLADMQQQSMQPFAVMAQQYLFKTAEDSMDNVIENYLCEFAYGTKDEL